MNGAATKVYRVQSGPAMSVARPAGSGGVPTVTVAASNSTEMDKARADYVCSGTDDQQTLQTAVDALPAGTPGSDDSPLFSGGGRVLCCEGVYNVSGTTHLDYGTRLEGLGHATIFRVALDTEAFPMFVVPHGAQVAACQLDGQAFDHASYVDSTVPVRHVGLWLSRKVGGFDNVDYVAVENVAFVEIGGVGIYADGGDFRIIRGCWFVAVGVVDRSTDVHTTDYTNLTGYSRDSPSTATWGAAVSIRNAGYDLLSYCKFYLCELDCVLLAGADFAAVSHCEFSDNVFGANQACVTVVDAQGVNVSGCEANLYGSSLVNLRAVGTAVRFVTVAGNNTSSGFAYYDPDTTENLAPVTLVARDPAHKVQYCQVVGNMLYGGVVLDGDGVVDNAVDANFTYRGISGPSGLTGSCGILVTNGASRNNVKDNTVRWSTEGPTYAIWVTDAACTDNWVTVNDCRAGYATAAIQDDGTGTDLAPYNKT